MAMSWQYIAGFFDGEGSIGFGAHNSGRKAVAYISQSGPSGLSVLREIQKFLLENGIKSSVFETGKAGVHKRTMPSYRIGINGYASVISFCKAVYPYLWIKKVSAQDLLRYDLLYPNINKSPMAAAWRSEKQKASADKIKASLAVTFAKRCKVDAAVRRWL